MVLGFIFELIFELLLEIIGEYVVQILGDAVFKPLWRRYGSERRKAALLGALVGLTAFGYGYAWGAYRVHDGATTLPQSVWVTLAMAVGFGLAAAAHPKLPSWGPQPIGRLDLRTGQRVPDPLNAEGEDLTRFANVLFPWRWTRARLGHFAASNVAISAGIAAGYLTWG